MLQAAWDAGIRVFDTAPLYGCGLAEKRLGDFLSDKPRESYVISTKVGRRVNSPEPGLGPSFDTDTSTSPGCRFDFSYDGVMRSVEDSINRTGISNFDILLIHDPDSHMFEAKLHAYKALDKLRAEGVVTAVGAGMNQNEALAELVDECDLDIILLAGRYTILDHSALTELLPICQNRGTTVLIGGVFNSGVLNNPVEGAHFDYLPLDDKWRQRALTVGARVPKAFESGSYWLERAQSILAICDRHHVPIHAVALQFAAAHPLVSSIIVGVGRSFRFQQNIDAIGMKIPASVWQELRAAGLLAQDAPIPAEVD
jgi:D-threo-aldose 1-dehydrogenase